jgi:hypothetical protein
MTEESETRLEVWAERLNREFGDLADAFQAGFGHAILPARELHWTDFYTWTKLATPANKY